MRFIDIQNEADAYIDGLSLEAQPLWGIMTPQHMIEHLLFVLEIVTQNRQYEIVTPEDKIERAQAFAMSDKPMPRNFQAPFIVQNALEPLRFSTLEEAKIGLKQGVADFFSYFEQNPEAVIAHPIFGKCNYPLWKKIQDKHFTHHFAQFGMIEEDIDSPK